MNVAPTARSILAAILIVPALTLTGCASSTGNASVSQQQVENKLKTDSHLTAVKTNYGTHFESLVNCIAKALKKDAKGSDLDDYVHGKKSLTAVKGKADAVKNDVQDCAKAAVAK